jgi:hypothetical protein
VDELAFNAGDYDDGASVASAARGAGPLEEEGEEEGEGTEASEGAEGEARDRRGARGGVTRGAAGRASVEGSIDGDKENRDVGGGGT